MEPTQRFLLIADIGGYTRFMKVQETALAHAQVIVARLLEAVIDAGRGLELEKLEGDAAFFSLAEARAEPWIRSLPERARAIHRRFHERRQQLAADRTCRCESCALIDRLTLKFVAHAGQVARQQVGRRHELAGVCVIQVHRMLKNTVPAPRLGRPGVVRGPPVGRAPRAR